MAVSSRKARPTFRDLVDDDAMVVALDSFRPLSSAAIERGRFYKLTDPAVVRWPAMFAICIRVDEIDNVIER